MVRKKECDGSQAWWSEKRKRSLQYICCRRQGESETTHAHREETDLFTHCRVLASSPTTAYSTIDCTGHDGLAGSFFLLSPQWGWMEANGSLRKQRAHSGRLTHVSTVMVLNAPTSHTPPPGLCVEQINPHLDQIQTRLTGKRFLYTHLQNRYKPTTSYLHGCQTNTWEVYVGTRKFHPPPWTHNDLCARARARRRWEMELHPPTLTTAYGSLRRGVHKAGLLFCTTFNSSEPPNRPDPLKSEQGGTRHLRQLTSLTNKCPDKSYFEQGLCLLRKEERLSVVACGASDLS